MHDNVCSGSRRNHHRHSNPDLTSQFNNLNEVSWYNASYLLTACAFQLPYGEVYYLFGTRWVFLSAIAMFEAGSAVCGAAPNSMALIIGHTIQGED
jgi:MFS family permease